MDEKLADEAATAKNAAARGFRGPVSLFSRHRRRSRRSGVAALGAGDKPTPPASSIVRVSSVVKFLRKFGW